MKLPEMSLRRSIVLVVIAVLLTALITTAYVQSKYPGENTECYYTPSQQYSYVIGPYNTTYYYMQNQSGYGSSTYEGYDYMDSSDDIVLTYAIDNLTSSNGTIFVKSGSYSAVVTLKTNVHLILDRGVSGITVSINAGATCELEDHQAGLMKFYVGGVLMMIQDLTTGRIDGTYGNFTNLLGNYLFLGLLGADPGAPVAGQMWYNAAEDTMKYYNGTAIVIFPGIGGGSSSTYTLPYSYTIYKSGSTYYKEKYDGTLWSSTSFSSVLQNTVGNLTSGRILLRNGVHIATTMLNVTAGKNIVLEGEDWEGTIIQDDQDTDYSRTIEGIGGLTVKNIKFDRSTPSSYTHKYVFYCGNNITTEGSNIVFDHCQFIGNTVLADLVGGADANHHMTGAIGGYMFNRSLTVKDCFIKNFQYAIFPTQPAYLSASGNTLQNVQTMGIGPLYVIPNSIHTIQNNVLNETGWYDEGICIDAAVGGSTAIMTSSLIEGNIMYNNVKDIANTGIGCIGASGVQIVGNKIYHINAAYGNLISCDLGDTTGISGIVIENNYLYLTRGNGIVTYGLCNGTISGNVIETLTYDYSVGIYIQYNKAVAHLTGTITISGNDIRTGTATQRGILLQRNLGTGGTVAIYIDNNYLWNYKGIETDWDGTLFTVTVGKNNIFKCTVNVGDTAAGTAKYLGKSDYSYMIAVSGSNYEMWNGLTGALDCYSTNASAVINNAIGNLTSGRTWQETVYCKGNFTITRNLLVPSYTHLILDGEFYAANGLDESILRNTGFNGAPANSFITIEGGSWYGNSANQVNIGSDLALIYWRSCTDSLVKNVYFYDSAEFAIALNGGNNRTKILNNRFEHCGQTNTKGPIFLAGLGDDYQEYNEVSGNVMNDSSQNGIYWGDNSLYGKITDNTVTNFARVGFGGGISVRGNGTIVSNNHVYNQYGDAAGAYGIGSPVGTYAYNVTVSNNWIRNVTQSGIFVQGNYWIISGNQIEYCSFGNGYNGIYLYGSSYATVDGNILSNCGGTTGYGINLYNSVFDVISNNIVKACGEAALNAFGTCPNITITNNQFLDSPGGWGVEVSDASNDRWIFTGNTIKVAVATQAMSITAGSLQYSIVKNNLGFVTENSVSGTNTTTTTAVINHGLASTASFVWCSFSFTGWTSWTWTSTATQITITVTGTLPATWTVYAKVEYVP